MGFKMKSPYGKGSHDTSSSHGTNSNYGKSGAPSMLGNILTGGMMGLGKKLFGKGKGGQACPPGQQAPQTPGNPPPQPAAPAPAAPVTPAPEEQVAAGATMKKELKTGAPKIGEKHIPGETPNQRDERKFQEQKKSITEKDWKEIDSQMGPNWVRNKNNQYDYVGPRDKKAKKATKEKTLRGVKEGEKWGEKAGAPKTTDWGSRMHDMSLSSKEREKARVKYWQRKDDREGKTDERMKEAGHQAWHRRPDGTVIAGTKEFVEGVKQGKIKESQRSKEAKKAGAPLANPNYKDLRKMKRPKSRVPSKPMTAEQKKRMEKMAGEKKVMKKAGPPLKGILRKGDEMVRDLGDKYNKSSIGRAMAKADKWVANLGRKKKNK